MQAVKMIMLARRQIDREEPAPARNKDATIFGIGERQKGDLTESIWSVPEIIAKLSEQVSLGARDIIMT